MDDRVTAGPSAPLAACSGAGAEFSASDFTAPFAASAFGETIAAISNGFGLATRAFGAQVLTFRRSVKEVETGNATGITIISADLAPKRLAMLRELAPNATDFATLTNPDTPEGNVQASDAIAAAERLGIKLSTLRAPDESAIEAAFAKLSMQPVDAVLLGSDPVFDVDRYKVVKLATALGRPVIYQFRNYAAAGGLMSYGPDISDAYRRAGLYAAQILRGATPG